MIKLLIIVGEFYMTPYLGAFVSALGVINGTQNVGPRESQAKNCNSAVSAREIAASPLSLALCAPPLFHSTSLIIGVTAPITLHSLSVTTSYIAYILLASL